MFSEFDRLAMTRALALAERGLETTHPNPRVGCVIAKGGRIIAEGWHERAGEPHAEVVALRAAKESVVGATAYVTLEPCSHHGRTPPCANALIEARIARVVFAVQDPNPRVSGQGADALLRAGIGVEAGLMEAEATEINIGFMKRMKQGLPWVRVKLAMSLDGRTALANGASQWITGEAARDDVQRWRARCGAVVTGVGTVLADDPLLNVRLGGDKRRQPLRVVLDGRLRSPPGARLFAGDGGAGAGRTGGGGSAASAAETASAGGEVFIFTVAGGGMIAEGVIGAARADSVAGGVAAVSAAVGPVVPSEAVAPGAATGVQSGSAAETHETVASGPTTSVMGRPGGASSGTCDTGVSAAAGTGAAATAAASAPNSMGLGAIDRAPAETATGTKDTPVGSVAGVPAGTVGASAAARPTAGTSAIGPAKASAALDFSPAAFQARRAALTARGVRVEEVPAEGGFLDLFAVLDKLAKLEVNEVLVEAGATLAGQLLIGSFVDELLLYIAPKLLGPQGRPLVNLPELQSLQDAWGFSLFDAKRFGDDLRLRMRPK